MSGDTHFSNVTLLLKGDGANGSTTIVDSSPAPKTATVSGDAQISTSQAKFGPSSLRFGASGGHLKYPADAGFAMGSEDFTVEAWVFPTATPSTLSDIVGTNRSGGAGNGWCLRLRPGMNPVAGLSTNGADYIGLEGAATIPLNAWSHVALVRNGSTATLYVNGTSSASASITGAQFDPGAGLAIGRNEANSSWYFFGHIDDLRITKGVARYTADFTPPTDSFPSSGLSVSGMVYDASGNPAGGRIIRAYNRSTGALVAQTTSSLGTGTYSLALADGVYTLVCLDDDTSPDYNALVIDRAVPS